MTQQEDTQAATEVLKEATDALEQAQERNNIAKEILNLPEQFEVDGKQVFIQHMGSQVLTAIQSAQIKMQLLKIELIQINKDDSELLPTERMKKINDIQIELYNHSTEILFYLINPDPWAEEPDFTKEWIGRYLPITGSMNGKPPSVGLQIIRSYKGRISSIDFFSEVWDMPVF